MHFARILAFSTFGGHKQGAYHIPIRDMIPPLPTDSQITTYSKYLYTRIGLLDVAFIYQNESLRRGTL